MSFFCYISRYFSYRRHSVSFKLQLIWGNAIVSVVARVFTWASCLGLCWLNSKQLHISLFSNLTTLVLWKKHCLWEPWMTMLLLTLIIALSVSVTICIFWNAYDVHKASNEHFAPVKKQTFAEQKNAQQRWIKIASLSKPVIFNRCFAEN